ncbi:MAG TPA: 5-formyltetrahydrofolate cyclo-ligase [Casimicrobiaceae bacterium]|nr:5-formyltetrahydrofolate cyclo-ligase [Casimicrobiaceae bacterium]
MSTDDRADAKGLALREAKLALRGRVLLARDALGPEERSRSAEAIVARIVALPSFLAAHTVLLTLAFRSEWATMPLIVHALAQHKELALPRVNVDTRMLELHRVRDPALEIEPGYRGIPEPRATCPVIPPALVDWVLVPGVAFDRAGRRLGYGGGFYDRLLPLIPAHAPRVAAAYAIQIVDHVPAAPHDVTMDAIVTEQETITLREIA